MVLVSLTDHIKELFPIEFVGDFEGWKLHARKHFAKCAMCKPRNSFGRALAARAGYSDAEFIEQRKDNTDGRR